MKAMKMKIEHRWFAALLLVLAGCAVAVMVPEHAPPCLPASAPTGVLSWPVAYASTEVAKAEGGGAAIIMVGYVSASRAAVVGWYLGEPAYFDGDPANPDKPAAVNARLMNDANALRAKPEGPCRWRLVTEKST